MELSTPFFVGGSLKGASDECVIRSMLKWLDSLGLVRAEIKTDPEPSIMEVASQLQKKCHLKWTTNKPLSRVISFSDGS
eukprot:4440912-Amphidinium_carterae.2